MRTPAGKECRYYYQDFHRGRNVQECRLVDEHDGSLPWKPSDCSKCPVPDILQANANPNLALTLRFKPVLLGLGRRTELIATCSKHKKPIADPYVGCSECNQERPNLDAFIQALESMDDDPNA